MISAFNCEKENMCVAVFSPSGAITAIKRDATDFYFDTFFDKSFWEKQ